MKILPWSKDKWLSKNGDVLIYDKLEHFLVSMILVLLSAYLMPLSTAAFLVWLGAIAYEVYDGFRSYDGVHVEGFSIKDLIANVAGIFTAILLCFLFEFNVIL